jgi:hypothetical protein
MLDAADLDKSWPALERALELLVLSSRRDAAALAAGYLTAFRSLEGAAGVATVISGANLPAAILTASLRVTGPVAIKKAMALGQSLDLAGRTGLVQVAGSVARLVLNGGRETLHRTIEADKSALGFARVASGSACAFCAMVASRGPVYKSQETAKGGDRGYHDHCNCGIQPVYHRDAAWPDNARKYEKLWAETTAGLSGDEARNAFRRALANN